MKSRFFLILILLLCGTLTACGGSDAEHDSDNSASRSSSQSAFLPPVDDDEVSADAGADADQDQDDAHDQQDGSAKTASDAESGKRPNTGGNKGSGSSHGSGSSQGSGSNRKQSAGREKPTRPVSDRSPVSKGGSKSPASNRGSKADDFPQVDEGSTNGVGKEVVDLPEVADLPEVIDVPEVPDLPEIGQLAGSVRIVDVDILGESKRYSASRAVTFGQVFNKGDVPKGRTLVAAVGGKAVPMQVDKKATWSDGSLRHAVITVRPDQSGASDLSRVSLAITGARFSASSTGQPAPVSLNTLLATAFDATVTLKANGKSFSASARNALQQLISDDDCPAWGRKQCKRWLKGPLASEWIVAAPLQDAPADMANLRVFFNVRAYANESGGIDNVRVDTVLENDLAYVPISRNISYSATINVGEQSYSIENLKHYRQARWHKLLWWNGDPSLYARIDGEYLQSTKAVSNYAHIEPDDKFLDSLRSGVRPMTNGEQTKHMGITGAQQSIGPLPRWTTTYVVSTDKRAFQWMLANDDAVGSYSFHFRDNETGRPLEITRHPFVTIANLNYARRASKGGYQRDLLPDCAGDCNSPYSFDIAHHPSIGVVPYLVTGDFYYLEEMQFTGSYIELWSNPDYRGASKGTLNGAQRQIRGQAWALRSVADAAFATPDADPMKAYFNTMVSNILADYTQKFLDDPHASPLHVINDDSALAYKVGGQKVALAPWQQDFFAWSVGHAAEMDFAEAKPFIKWLAEFAIGRMTNWTNHGDGFCWLQAASYTMRIRDTHSGTDYPDLQTVYRKQFPGLVGLECNSQQMVNLWAGGRYQRGEMSGYAFSSTGFPSNFQIALAMAADTGIADAKNAWSIFSNRSVKPAGSKSYSEFPNFAVEPRYLSQK